MTIAACYLSPEGVVLGADSTTTFGATLVGTKVVMGEHHFNYGQKIFEIGREGHGTLGLSLWGLGSMGDVSCRTIVAEFSDSLEKSPPLNIDAIPRRWARKFWAVYRKEYRSLIEYVAELDKDIENLSPEKKDELEDLVHNASGGFCLGGRYGTGRTPRAYTITYSPRHAEPDIEPLQVGVPEFWGWPNLLRRLSIGIDEITLEAIIDSGKWTGTPEELVQIVTDNRLGRPSKHLPLREAVDWIYASIYTTIKTMKFSHLPPVCGGPIEVAVITSDRPFRWVRHKKFDAAIGHTSSPEA